MILFLLAFLGGVLTILSPCILPVLPFVFARADRPFLKSGLPLLAGMAVSFAAIATLATVGGSWAVHANAWGRALALVLLTLFGLTLLLPALADRLMRPLVALGDRLSSRAGAEAGIGASLLLGVVGGGLFWYGQDAQSLPALAVAHMPEEIRSLDLTRPIGAQAINEGFAARGLRLRGPLPGDVTYVHDCPVGRYLTVHLVSRVDDTSVAVLYVPGEHTGAMRDFDRGGWHGRIVPLQHGRLVLLTDRASRQSFDRVADTVSQDWRVAIDGLDGPRVSEL